MTSIPEMCTEKAIEQGCTCRIPFATPYDIDPPEPKRNKWCPLHGRDPDYERDRMMDEMRGRAT